LKLILRNFTINSRHSLYGIYNPICNPVSLQSYNNTGNQRKRGGMHAPHVGTHQF